MPESQHLREQAREAGSGFIAFSPLAQGLLTDRYISGIPSDSRASRNFSLKRDSITPELSEKISRLNGIAAERGQTLAQMALAWVLKDDLVTSVIIGASSKVQIADNIQATRNTIFSEEEIRLIDNITR